MKYRIITGYPKGFCVESRSFLFLWRIAVTDQGVDIPFLFPTVEYAKDAIEALKKAGKVVYKEK